MNTDRKRREERDVAGFQARREDFGISDPLWISAVEEVQQEIRNLLIQHSTAVAQALNSERLVFLEQLNSQRNQVLERCQLEFDDLQRLLRKYAAKGDGSNMASSSAFGDGLPSSSFPLVPFPSVGRCGYGSHIWNRKSTTSFGRQFQYLRGHDLFCSHFQEEFELNFVFESPHEMIATWKKYHPNGKQWRSIQNLACRTICRRYIYRYPPPLRKDDEQQMAQLKEMEILEFYQHLPTLSQGEHEEVWSGFEHLAPCHYKWSQECFQLWYKYELSLHAGRPTQSKKQVEREVLKLDTLLRPFVPTHNPNGYVMLSWDGSNVVLQPINGVPTPVPHPALVSQMQGASALAGPALSAGPPSLLGPAGLLP
eukprot:RCo052362